MEPKLRHIGRLLVCTLLLGSTFVSAGAQQCGCADADSCPQSVAPGQTAQICYELTDALNDDLTDPTQGVCGVSLAFQHGNVEDLSIALISPAGQLVDLVGAPCNGPTISTAFSTWRIDFVPCSATPAPDTLAGIPIASPWDNCNGNEIWPIGNYSGSYHPHAGCLEDFDTGPVNGSWCLLVQNNSPFHAATILDFSIDLCDNSGIFCCEADAGSLPYQDLRFCATDSASLQLLELDPYGSTPPPDTAQYGYLWLIGRADTLVALAAAPDYSTLDTGTWTICGLSYLLADSSLLPSPGSTLLSSLAANLASDSAAFCGDLTPHCLTLHIAPPPDTTFLDTTLCQGDTLFLADTSWTESGTFVHALSSWSGCDSIIQLSLYFHPADTTWIDTLLCAADTLTLADSSWWQAGSYQLLLTNQQGCDSLLLIELAYRDTVQSFRTDTLCLGDTLWIGDTSYWQSGQYLLVWPAASGCDSLVWLDLTVLAPSAQALPPDTLTCLQPAIWLDASPSAALSYSWTTPNGHFLSDPDSTRVLIDAPGTYVFHARTHFCESTDTLFVLADTLPPFVDAGPDTALTCAHPQISLSANVGPPAAPLDLQWQGPGLSANDTLPVLTVGLGGWYALTATNLANGCSATDSVEVAVDTLPPAVALPDSVGWTCLDTGALLIATSAPPAHVQFQWYDPTGSPLPASDTAAWLASWPGIWQVHAIDANTGCSATDSTLVWMDTLPPSLFIAPPDTLTCFAPSVWLDASASQRVAQFHWSGPNGTLPDSAVVQTNAAGLYLLIGTSANGCTDTAAAFVPADTTAPIADAGPDLTLTCGQPSAVLGTSNTSMGAFFNYLWQTPEGTLPPPADTPFVAVDSAGMYWLVVTDTRNGCSASDTVLVHAWLDPPVADAGPDLSLDCQTPVVWLDGSASDTGAFIGYAWYTIDGTFLSNSMQHSVNFPDTFVLHVQNTFTFCESQDTVVVQRTAAAPVAEAGPPQAVNCQTGIAALDAGASDSGPHIRYAWTALQGVILAGAQTLSPLVTGPGTYLLTLEDTLNDCVAVDTAFVVLDTAACMPTAAAGPDQHIDCANEPGPLDTLDASGSTSGPAMSYHWTALTGSVLDSSDVLHPLVSAGTFVLEVRNDLWMLSAFDTVTVTIDTIHPVADAGPPIVSATCPQLEACLLLGGSNTSVGPRYTYEWQAQAGGSFCGSTQAPLASVQATGLYNLIVRDTVNHCTSEAATVVQYEGVVPIAEAGPDVQIPCGDSIAWLDGSGSLQDSAFAFEWFSLTGNVIPTDNPQAVWGQPTQAADTFYLVVSSQQNMCRDTDAVVVFAPVNCYPECHIATPPVLTCAQDSIQLDGTASETGPEFAYQWTALSGHLCGGDTTLTPCVDAPGIYQLAVTNTLTSFTSTCQVEVFDMRTPPQVDAGPSTAITCATPTPALHGSYTPNVSASAWWHTVDGQFSGSSQGLTTTVSTPGWYWLTVIRHDNGCSATDSVYVDLDTLSPTAEAGPPALLTCATSTAVLAGTADQAGASYYWHTPDGELCAGQQTPNPVACAPGTYILTVVADNGCTDSDTTTVIADPNALSCSAGPDTVFTCLDSVLTLEGQAQGGALLTYAWSSPDGGTILSGAQSLTLQVGSPGTYLLEVHDLVNACTCQSVVVVHADTLPPVPALPDTAFITCDTLAPLLDASQSTATHGLLFSWDGPGLLVPTADAPAIQVAEAGTYWLTLTDTGNGCTTTDSVAVILATTPPPADAGADTTLTCSRTELTLSAATAPHLRYLWFLLGDTLTLYAQQAQIAVSEAGTYLLSVTDTLSGCTRTDTVQVSWDTIRPLAVISAPQGLTRTCAQPTLLLDGSSAAPTDSLAFEWWTPDGLSANTAQWSATQAGLHLLRVRHLRTGCSDTAAVVVEEDLLPPAFELLALDTLSCRQQAVRMQVVHSAPDTAAVQVQWASIPVGLPIAAADSTVATLFEAGLYEVVVTNPSNGCTARDTFAPPSDLSPPLVEAISYGNLSCDTLSVLLVAKVVPAETATIAWLNASGDTLGHLPSLSVSAPGWYHLFGTNADNGCSQRDSVFVAMTDEPIRGIYLSLHAPACYTPDWKATLAIDSIGGGTGPFAYALDDMVPVLEPVFAQLSPGKWRLTVEDVNGCTRDTLIEIQAPTPLDVAVIGPEEVLLGESAWLTIQTTRDSSQIAEVIWHPAIDTACTPPCLSVEFQPLASMQLTATVIDAYGCAASDVHALLVRKDGPLFAPTAFSPNGDGYNDRFALYGGPQIARIATFEIYDRWGTLVFRSTDMAPNDPLQGWDGYLRGQPAPPGVYVWRAELVLQDGSREKLRGEVLLAR